jgi:hypothetical protein
MKTTQWIGILCLISLSSIFSGALAQGKTNNDVPQNVSAAFKAKYPLAQVKSCKQNKTGYAVKFILDNKKYQAIFDKQGHWSETVSNVSWQWHLPGAVKAGLKKSPHGTWHPYNVNFVEASSGQYYRVMVDNTNHPVAFAHQLVLTEDWEIDVNPSGKVISEKSID